MADPIDPGEPEGAAGEGPAGEGVGAALHRGARYLARRGVPSPERSARFLLAHALGVEPGRLVARLREPVADGARRAYGRLLCARGRRRPLQHLLGEWEFWGLALEVGPQALVPRPETETLVERALALLDRDARLVADVGTGTGAVAIALAHERPGLRVLATDVSGEALALAARNVARHALAERVELLAGELLAVLRGRVEPAALDGVVANLPYVSEKEWAGLMPEVRDHEPRTALVPGPTGLEAMLALVGQAPEWLRPGGLLALEMGATQGDALCAALDHRGYRDVAVTPDLEGRPRVVTARRGAVR